MATARPLSRTVLLGVADDSDHHAYQGSFREARFQASADGTSLGPEVARQALANDHNMRGHALRIVLIEVAAFQQRNSDEALK